jgi:hypothetical protein
VLLPVAIAAGHYSCPFYFSLDSIVKHPSLNSNLGNTDRSVQISENFGTAAVTRQIVGKGTFF